MSETINETSKRTGHTIGKKRRTTSEKESDEYYKKVALDGMQKALSRMDDEDSFQTFGNFVASELRKISNFETANRIQRKLNRALLDCIDEIDCSKGGSFSRDKNESNQFVEEPHKSPLNQSEVIRNNISIK